MDNEKRQYNTRFNGTTGCSRYGMLEEVQGMIGGIMMAVCWPDKDGIPTNLSVTANGIHRAWLYKCECTPEQYARFTEIISGYFNPNEIDFDLKA